MEGFLILTALKDFLRARRLAIWIVIIVILFGLSKAYIYVRPGVTPQDAYIQLSGLMVYRVLALAAAIFSTAVISQEIEQKTIVYLVTRPIPRPVLLLTRLAATIIVVFGLSFMAAVSVSIATHGVHALTNDVLWRDFKGLLAGSAAYSTLFVFFSLLINRSMLVSLFFAFGWELFIPNLQGDSYRLSIFPYLKAIAQRPTAGDSQTPFGFISGQTGQDVLSATTGWITIIVLVGGLAMLSAWWFKNFEYLPREDAE
jgi:ABC-2 type transport system permease protein